MLRNPNNRSKVPPHLIKPDGTYSKIINHVFPDVAYAVGIELTKTKTGTYKDDLIGKIYKAFDAKNLATALFLDRTKLEKDGQKKLQICSACITLYLCS